MKKYFIIASILLLSAACSKSEVPEVAWEAYQSSQYNFSFEYPNDWSVVTQNETIIARPGSGSEGPPIIIQPELVDDPVFEAGATSDKCEVSNITFAGKAAKQCASKLNSVAGRKIKILGLPSGWTEHNEISYSLPSQYTNLVSVYESVLSSFKFTEPLNK